MAPIEANQHRRYLAEYLGAGHNFMKFQKQVHEDDIRVVDESSGEAESDGLATFRRGIFLNLTLADCCGILIYDPKAPAVAALHSGWRGAHLNIAAKGIRKMGEWFASSPEDLLVWLTPCASGENYEVGPEVAEYFPDFAKSTDNEKFLLDLPGAVRAQLMEIGVPNENIESAGMCTIADDRFHSFRRERGLSGRMAAFISLK
ncbi:MAG: peptidoglycan editing factor PgeF [Candidatus Kapaibacterium sp.]